MNYSQILKAHREYVKSSQGNVELSIAALTNTTIDMAKPVLELMLSKKGMSTHVSLGDYDNIVQDSIRFRNYDVALIFFDLINIFDEFSHEINFYSETEIQELIEKTKAQLSLVFRNLADVSLVLINEFSYASFNSKSSKKEKLVNICTELNRYVTEISGKNTYLCRTNELIIRLGYSASFDKRFFYSSKSLYTYQFFVEYSTLIMPYLNAITGRSKKALIFDCDNTLWRGIVGEDGTAGIDCSNGSKKGRAYYQVQRLALQLKKSGVLLGICSKNNINDVEEVFKTNRDMYLSLDDFVIKKVNWNNKADNLCEISQELNIGLDSLVFIDDSDFEINLIRETLPQVATFQVPSRSWEYPEMFEEVKSLFFNPFRTNEDEIKTHIYQDQERRKNYSNQYDTLSDYLKALDIRINLHFNKEEILPRMAQMTQKTNQFNLTTKRYSEASMSRLIREKTFFVVAWNVQDKFGDNGITGLAILLLDFEKSEVLVDSFLQSCRIIGRNIEFAVFDEIIKILKDRNFKTIRGTYVETSKNMQVKDFYDRLGFTRLEENYSINYRLNINEYEMNNINYKIDLDYGN